MPGREQGWRGGGRQGDLEKAGATSFPPRTPWTRSEARAASHPAIAAGPGSLGLTLSGPGGREQEPGHAGPRKRYRAYGPPGDASERSLGRPGIPLPRPGAASCLPGAQHPDLLPETGRTRGQTGPPSGEPSYPGVREDSEGQEGPPPERDRRAQRRPGRVRARVTMSRAWASGSP